MLNIPVRTVVIRYYAKYDYYVGLMAGIIFLDANNQVLLKAGFWDAH